MPDDVVRRLFALAQRTPSWCNSQAWQVHLGNGEATTALADRLSERVLAGPEAPDTQGPARYTGPYQDRRRTCRGALGTAVASSATTRRAGCCRRCRTSGSSALRTPRSSPRPSTSGPTAGWTASGYVANLLNAAETLGINAIAQAAVAVYADVVRAELDIPEDRSVVCAVSFGYADPDHPANGFRTERADLSEVVVGLP